MRLSVFVTKPVIGDPMTDDLYYEVDVDGSGSADTDSLRQSGVSADTVLAPSVGSPMVVEAN